MLPSKSLTKSWPFGLAIILVIVCWVQVAPAADAGLVVNQVGIDPIAQGKNLVHLGVSNRSQDERVFGIHIYTRSPEYGGKGVGWGTSFYETVGGKRSGSLRFVFKIQGPLTPSTWIRLRFYDVGAARGFDREDYDEIKAKRIELGERRYDAEEIARRKPVTYGATSPEDRDVAITFFGRVQTLMARGQTETLWRHLTRDYQRAEFQDRVRILQSVLDKKPPSSIFYFDPDDIISLHPADVKSSDAGLRLTGQVKDQSIYVDLVKEGSSLRVDWIGGYIPQVARQQNWQQRLLPAMEKKQTEHFDLYYFKGSTVEKDIEVIARERERAYRHISQFLSSDPQVRAAGIFFEDETRKFNETGHMGKGWAFGRTIVEVYNAETRLDPYHETVHVLTRHLGSPPAMFTEGLAVYMAEALGAQALLHLGGGKLSINDHLKGLKQDGKWIALSELIRYDNIGSQGEMTTVAYTEAASFVKFLIAEFGKDRFLEAYGTLKNTNNTQVQQQNVQRLEQIYGESLATLEAKWSSRL